MLTRTLERNPSESIHMTGATPTAAQPITASAPTSIGHVKSETVVMETEEMEPSPDVSDKSLSQSMDAIDRTCSQVFGFDGTPTEEESALNDMRMRMVPENGK